MAGSGGRSSTSSGIARFAVRKEGFGRKEIKLRLDRDASVDVSLGHAAPPAAAPPPPSRNDDDDDDRRKL